MTETPDPLVVPLCDIDQRIEDWRAIPQTPEQAVAQEAVDKTAERLSTPPFSWGGSIELNPSSPENEADAGREIDETLEYPLAAPPEGKGSSELLVWRVQLSEAVAYVGESRETTTLYLAALTAPEALAGAARIIAHPDTPYPASLVPRNARELVDKPTPAVVLTDTIEEEDRDDPGPL